MSPGDEQVLELLVKNDEANPLRVIGTVEAFGVDQKTGSAIFGGVDVATAWIQPSGALTLDPHTERSVIFHIRVPVSAEPSAHYLALFVREDTLASGVSVSSRVGSLLFLYVAGTVRETLTYESFTASQSWYSALPIVVQSRLKNSGTIHVVPRGSVVARNWRGKIIETMTVNPLGRMSLPSTFWQDEFIFTKLRLRDVGPISITSAISRSNAPFGEEIFRVLTVWYVPWGLMGILIGMMGVMCIGILYIRKSPPSNPRSFL